MIRKLDGDERGFLGMRLASAKAAAEKLAKETDALNGKFEQVESALVALNLGVNAGVNLVSESSTSGSGAMLSFQKVGGVWGLFLTNVNGQVVPIKSGSRHYRMAATEGLPELINQLVGAVETETLDVKGAAENLDTLLADLAASGIGAPVVPMDGVEAPGMSAFPAKGGAHVPDVGPRGFRVGRVAK